MSVKVNVDTKVRLTSTGQTTFVKKVVMGTPVRSTVEDPGNITGLRDVDISNVTNDQILVFDSSTSSFVNKDSASLTNLRITNNLIVEGTTTSINTTNLDIEDHNITLAKGIGATYEAAGAGITIDLVDAKIVYDNADDQWDLNRGINVTGNSVITGNLLPGADSTYDLGDSNTKWKDLYLSGSTIHLGGLDIKDQDGEFAVLDSTGSAVGYDLSGSAAAIRGFFSSGGDLSYDSSTGRFSFDVEQVYTKANFDSDFNVSLDEASLGGTGLTYDSSTNSINIASTNVDSGTYGTTSQVPIFTVNTRGQIDSAGQSLIAFGDDERLRFGANPDLEIYHNSSLNRSLITAAGTGQVYLAGTNVYLGGTAATTVNLKTTSGQGVELNYNSQKKLETTIYGATVTGTLNADSGTFTNLNADSGTFTNLTRTSTVDSATYGSQSLIPIITVNSSGFIDSIGTTSVAGVSGLTYDSSNGNLTISTAAGTSFSDSINLNPFSTTDLSEGNNLYYTTARADSDAKNAISGGAGITYTSGTGVIDITNTTVDPAVYGSASLVPVLTINSRGQIDSAGTVSVAGVSGFTWDSSIGQAIITTADGGSFPATIKGFGDNQILNFGDNNDLQFFHNGSLSHIRDRGTGELRLSTNGDQIRIYDTANTRTMAQFLTGNGLVTLWYNNSKKFETTDSGVLVSGSILADSAHLTSINFATNTGPPNYGEGVLWYDNTYHTLNYYGDDSTVVHNLGLEEHQRVFNNTGSTITKGAPLYFSGNYSSGSFDVPTVGLADATDVNAYNAQGLAASDIPNNSYGYCLIAGQLFNVDTSALSAGANFFVGLGPGLVQNASPLYPNFPMCLGWVVSSHATNGVLLVNQQNHSVNSFRVRTSAHVGTDLQVDGNLTVLGTQTTVGQSNVTQGAPFYRLNEGDAIGEANTTFTGSGLDDAFFAGHFKGTTSQTYYVRIDGVGTGPGGVDTFEVALGDDSTFTSPTEIKTPITGNPQLIHSIDNISVEFGSTTGHDSGDRWAGTASPINVDTGFFTNRNTGTTGVGYTHMGFYFDVSDDKWKVIDEYDSTPTGVINVTDSALGTLVATTFEGDLSGTFDGISSGSFLRSDAADTKTSGDLTFNDNVKAVFGDDDDLQIYHDGSASIISDQGTGQLRFLTNQLRIKNAADNETFINALANGRVELYYDGTKRFETTDSGVLVTGSLLADSASLKGPVHIDNDGTDGPGSGLRVADVEFYDFGTGDPTFRNANTNKRTVLRVLPNGTGITHGGHPANHSAAFEFFGRDYHTDPTTYHNFRIIAAEDSDYIIDTSLGSQQGNKGIRFNLGSRGSAQGYIGAENILVLSGDSANGRIGNVGIGTGDPQKTFTVFTDGTNNNPKTGKGLSGGQTGQGVLLHNSVSTTNSYANLDFRAGNADARIATQYEKANTGNMQFILDRDGIIRKSLQLDSAVKLYHATNSSESLKLETTELGINVDGRVDCDNIIVDAVSNGILVTASGFGTDVLNMSNHNIKGVNALFFNDPGADEGIIWNGGNTKIYESPNNLSNAAGNLQFIHSSTRRFTVDNYGAEAVGRLAADSATFSGNIRADGGGLILGDEAYSANVNLVGMKTDNHTAASEYMIIAGISGSDANTYVSGKTGGSVYIRGGGNAADHQFQVSSSLARAHGDFAFDSAGAVFFDKSEQVFKLGDNTKLRFGDGNDLEIRHDGSHSYIDENGTGQFYIRSNGTTKFSTTNSGAYVYYNGSNRLQTTSSGVLIDQHVEIGHDSSRLTTVSQTAITSFSSTTYTGGKFIITAHDHAAGSRQISELLVLRDSAAGTAYATEYGHIQTGTEIATYDVDINSGNVRVLATSTSTNPTTYQVAETLMRE